MTPFEHASFFHIRFIALAQAFDFFAMDTGWLVGL